MAALRRDRPSSNPAEALQTALKRLPEPSRIVYLLHARDQLSLGVIGLPLGLTPINVTWRHWRALEHVLS